MSTPGEMGTPILSSDTANESETKKSKPGKKLSVSNDPDRFKHGVLIRGKFIGVEDVKKENGDDVCQTAMVKLKAVVLAKKEHKQRICIKINLEGIEILDEKTNQLMFKHSVKSISYIARDTTDPRAIGYIYKNSQNNFQYFAIKTERQAQEFFNNLKDLFEVVLMMRTAEKKKNEEKTTELKEAENSLEEKKSEPLAQNELRAQSDSAPETKTPISNNLLDFPSNNFHDSWQENSDPNPSKSGPLKQASDELLDVFDNSFQNQTSANDDASSKKNNENSQNDKYNSLLNELSNLSTSPEQRNPLVSYTQPLNSPLSHNGTQNLSPYQQPPQFSTPYQNPFGTFNMYSNQTQMINRPPPEIPNHASIASQPKLNIPNTYNQSINNSNNQNNQNNHFPW